MIAEYNESFSIRQDLKNVLIRRLDKSSSPEILHKGDLKWEYLIPNRDIKYEDYCRAVYLGQGCWDDLKSVTAEEVAAILKEWGYNGNPPAAE